MHLDASHAEATGNTLDAQTLLVFIHGVGMNAKNWCAQKGFFDEHYACCYVDLPGHGMSGPLQIESAQSLLDLFCLTVSETIDLLPVATQQIVLVGHSLGALIACHLAATTPKRFAAVVALSTVHDRSDAALKAVQARAFELADEQSELDLDTTLNRWFTNDEHHKYELEHAWTKTWLQEADRDAYALAYQAFASTRGVDAAQAGKLHLPALFITGTKDQNSSPDMSINLASRAPEGDIYLVEGARHMCHLTHAQEVNQAMLTFLKSKHIH